MRLHTLLVLVTLALLSLDANAASELLQNDSFVSGQPASFQGGFVANEMAAVRYTPTIACPCTLDSLTVLFGGDTTSHSVNVLVWDDPGGTTPGTLLYSNDVVLTGATNFLQVIDLSAAPVSLTGPFRVGLAFNHDGLPGIATDLDGSIDGAANFILAEVGGLRLWFSSATLGVSGDFIVRAQISNQVDTDGDGVPDSLDNCAALVNADQRDDDGDGYGNRCDADFNNDCTVSVIDLGIMRSVFFQTSDSPDWQPAIDLNLDDATNLVDLGLLRTLFFAPPGPSGLANTCQ